MYQSVKTAASKRRYSLIQDIFAQPSVVEQLKSLGKTGESLVLPTVKCAHCKGTISEQMVRGAVRRVKPWLLSVRARAFCSRCMLASPVEMRLHSCGNAQILRHGQWITRRPRKAPDNGAGLAGRSRSFAGLVAAAYGKTREGVTYIYENRNEPLSTVFPKPAFLERFFRR